VVEERPGRRFDLGVVALLDDLGIREEPCADWAGSPSDLSRAALLKHLLALRLARRGRHAEARDAAGGVVRIYRRLSLLDPDRYQGELAVALTTWGVQASRAGSRELAAAALTDSVGLHRAQLARHNPLRVLHRARLQVGLATALTNLGLAQYDLEEHDEAREAAEEAVTRLHELRAHSRAYRLLARHDPTAFEHSMAGALSNLGVVLVVHDQPARARELAAEVVRVYRELARVRPTRYAAELAGALHNLGVAAAEQGDVRLALAATDEAVAVHRSRTEPAAEVVEPELGRSLCAYALVRAATGEQLDMAMEAAREAVLIHERLTEQLPQLYSADLHDAYHAVTRVRAASRGR
jgi:tetratricopeptide (TPR) repeat protein